jgi:hypothetical protein
VRRQSNDEVAVIEGDRMRPNDQASVIPRRELRDSTLDLGVRVHAECGNFDSEGRCGGFGSPQKSNVRCSFGMKDEADPADARCNLLEYFQPLSSDLGLEDSKSGDVAARPRQARDKTAPNWIAN